MRDMLSRRLAGIIDNAVQVGGRDDFPESEWQAAVRHFLDQVQGRGRKRVNPKIIFGTVTLRLDPQADTYFAYGRSRETAPAPAQLKGRACRIVGSGRQEVEVALQQLVNDDQIRALIIQLDQDHWLMLWKKVRRGRYGCAAYVPRTWRGLGPAMPA